MFPLSWETASFSAETSGSAPRMGSAISSTGLTVAMLVAIPARAVKAVITRP